jgi:hypothetical protein
MLVEENGLAFRPNQHAGWDPVRTVPTLATIRPSRRWGTRLFAQGKSGVDGNALSVRLAGASSTMRGFFPFDRLRIRMTMENKQRERPK